AATRRRARGCWRWRSGWRRGLRSGRACWTGQRWSKRYGWGRPNRPPSEVGGLYARAQGHGERVALAIYDQYRPQSMEDRVPRTVEGAVLALADKVDTIAGMFGLGLEPTG